ncbi:MAG: hypothetical protein HY908_12595 [Myxococcales bacterium]|nr:hypothetical protein [Myxococcales bacterium]
MGARVKHSVSGGGARARGALRAGVADRARETGLCAELEGLYARLDAVFAGSSCPASTECCRPGLFGREPYVTSLELALLGRAVARRGGELAPARRALPLAAAAVTAPEQGLICSLLDRDGRCSVYAARPFGCRSFFCERASHDRRVPHREVQALVRELEALARRFDPSGAVGRPLSRALAGPRRV